MGIFHEQTLKTCHSSNNVGSNLDYSKHDDTAEIRIGIYKGARSLGVELSIQKYETELGVLKHGVFINNLVEGGLIQTDGRIRIGDRLIAVKQYLPNGDTSTFDFEDGYTLKDTTEVKKILKRCKGQMDIYIVRESNYEEVVSPSTCVNNILIDPDKESQMCSPMSNDNIGISKNYECESETNKYGPRDSVTTYKMKHPMRQNASKRYALRFQEQSSQNVKYSAEQMLASK